MARKLASNSERKRNGLKLALAKPSSQPQPDLAPMPGILRTALIERVALAASARLILVHAPAGYGKSTLLRQIAARLAAERRPVAWVVLGPNDADVSRFLSLIGQACDRLQQTAGAAMAADAEDALRMTGIEGGATLLIDDFDLVATPEIAAALGHFLTRLSPGKQAIIATRGDPGLALGSMQLKGEAVVLGSTDLRFDLAETYHFLSGESRISLDEVRQLHNKTAGWPAALQFLSLALSRNHHFPVAALQTGVTPGLIDYLAKDVFEAQSEAIRSALLAICLPDQIDGALVGELCGVSRGAALLNGLADAGLMLDPVDGDRNWYRFHAVFRDFLCTRLAALETSEQIAATHVRIASWLVGHGAIDDAIGHYLIAGDQAAATLLLEQIADDLVRKERLGFIVSLIEQIEPERIRASPTILNAAIIAYGFRRKFAEAHTLLDFRERELTAGQPSPEERGELEGLRVFVLAAEDKIEQFGMTARDVLSLSNSDDAFTYGVALNAYAFLLIAQSQYQEAHDHLLRAGPLHERSGNHFGKSYQAAIFATLLVAQGRLEEAITSLRRALREAESSAPPGSVAGAIIAAYLGEALYEHGDMDGAEALLNSYLPLIEQQCIVDALSVALITLSRIAGRRFRPELQNELVERLIVLGHRHQLQRLVSNGRAELARLAILAGDTALAAGWLSSLENGAAAENERNRLFFHSGELETQKIVRIRHAIHLGRYSEARGVLQAEIHAATLKRRTRRLIRLHGLLALCLDLSGDDITARRALLEALRAAQPGKFQRIFLDEGPPMLKLLRDLAEHNLANLPRWTEDPLAEYVAELISAGGGLPVRSGLDLDRPLADLTVRETEMLVLIGNGMSTQNLADRFAVSPNTIKWHLKNIYEKLGIRNRMQAVNAARRLGLIT